MLYLKILIFFLLPVLCWGEMAKETITIPKDRYENIKCLITTLNLELESGLLDSYYGSPWVSFKKDFMINTLAGIRVQINEIDKNTVPLTVDEKLSLISGEISLIQTRLLLLEKKK